MNEVPSEKEEMNQVVSMEEEEGKAERWKGRKGGESQTIGHPLLILPSRDSRILPNSQNHVSTQRRFE